jgi:hypothetical protein
MTGAAPLETWAAAVGDRAVAIAAAPPPYWVDVALRSALITLRSQAMRDLEAGRFPADGSSLSYTLTRLGFAARRAECEALDLPERNPDLADLIDHGFAARVGKDWYETITRTAVTLMEAAQSPPEPRTAALLAPRGMGHDARRRLGEMMVDATLSSERGRPWKLGWIDASVLLECWRYGYYLSACAASLPPAASPALPLSPSG